MPNMISTCKSCGTPWVEHPDSIDTCRQLQAAKVEIERLRTWIRSERERNVVYEEAATKTLLGRRLFCVEQFRSDYEAETKRICGETP
jgi:hypothetical protein